MDTYAIFVFIELADEDLGEDDVFIIESIAGARRNEEDKLRVTMILTLLKDSMAALNKIIKIVEVNNGSIAHMETRDSSLISQDGNKTKMDVLLKVDIKHGSLIHFLKTLRRSSYLSDVHLLSSQSINLKCKIKVNICLSCTVKATENATVLFSQKYNEFLHVIIHFLFSCLVSKTHI